MNQYIQLHETIKGRQMKSQKHSTSKKSSSTVQLSKFLNPTSYWK